MRRVFATILAAGCLSAASASAQETVDVGVVKNSELKVVQRVLYPMKGKLEVGVNLGWMPFDPLVTTPNLQISIDKHITDTLAFSALIGGGYGLKTLKYKELEGPSYGVAPYAFRYLGSALFGVTWAPIYGKLSANGKRVVHYDLYGALRAGATAENSVIPNGGFTVAPTGSIGLGTRFYVSQKIAIRAEIRDDLMGEYRKLVSAWRFKQNASVMLGVSFILGGKGR